MISEKQNIGKYEIGEELGRGSMGVVYKAYDPYVNRVVAIKISSDPSISEAADSAINRKLFFNEAHVAGTLAHPNIVSIYDAGIANDICYIVMEYIEFGQTIKLYTKADKLLDIDTAVEMIFKCASALDYAHQSEVLHQDIKPSNILVTAENNVKIVDFSIARLNKPDAFDAQAVQRRGSPRYMAPEQLTGEPAIAQSDIYALGVVFYQLLTGTLPFNADTFVDLREQILAAKPKGIREHRADLPEVLEKIVNKAMHRDLSVRYQRCAEFALDLLNFMEEKNRHISDLGEDEKLFIISELDFFKGFVNDELKEIVEHGFWISCRANEEVILEGDIDDCFYIILSGEVAVLKGGREIRQLKYGDCFGEMGYLTKAMRTATIKTIEQTELLKITSTMLSNMTLAIQVNFLKVFLRTLIQRLSVTTSKLPTA